MFSSQPTESTSTASDINDQISKANLELLSTYTERREKCRASWNVGFDDPQRGSLFKAADETKIKLKTKILELSNLIKNLFHLDESTVKNLQDGLWKLEYGMIHTMDCQWEPTLEDILIICKQPQIATKVGDVLIWLHENKLANQSNLSKLSNFKWTHQDLTVLRRIHLSEYTGIGEVKIPVELKQQLFDGIIDNVTYTAENEMKSSSSSASVISHSSSSSSSGVSSSISEKYYRVKLTDLNTVLTLFHDLKEKDKEAVFKQSIVIWGGIKYSSKTGFENPPDTKLNEGFSKEETAELISELTRLSQSSGENHSLVEAENLFSDQEITFPTRNINNKQLYIITRILCAAATPSVKVHMFLGGPPEGWTPPVPTKEENQRTEKDNLNKVCAKQLRIQMLGIDRTEALISLWKCGKFKPVFDFDWIVRFFSLPEKHANDFSLAAQLLWDTNMEYELHKRWVPSLEDLDYITQYLRSQTVSSSSENSHSNPKKKASTGYDSDDDGNSYSYRVYNRDNKHPVLNLANALRWLGIHRLNTSSNKQILAQFADHIATLTCVKIGTNADEESIRFTQRIFNIIMAGIAQQLKSKVALSSSSVSSTPWKFFENKPQLAISSNTPKLVSTNNAVGLTSTTQPMQTSSQPAPTLIDQNVNNNQSCCTIM